MPANTDPVREAITEARRSQILEAAVQVFAEKGFHQAKIKDVAKAAGVADGTIYNYFNNKADLLVAMVAQFGELLQFSNQVKQFVGDFTPEQIMGTILRNRFTLLERNRAQFQAIMPQIINDPSLRRQFYETLGKPTLAILEQVWQAQVDQGHIRQIDPQIMVRLFLAMFFGVAILDIIGADLIGNDNERVVNAIQDLLLNGILPRSNGEGA
jgi:AcrR family transcriptional regulator